MQILIPFVSTAAAAVSVLAAFLGLIRFLAGFLLATIALSFVSPSTNALSLSYIADFVRRSPFHRAAIILQRFSKVHTTTGVKEPLESMLWVFFLQVLPLLLLFVEVVLPIGLSKCQVESTVDIKDLRLFSNVSDQSDLTASTVDRTDYEELYQNRDCYFLDGCTQIGNASYRASWLGARGLGDLVFREYKRSLLTGEILMETPRITRLASTRLDTPSAEYAGKLLIDREMGGFSPVNLVSPVRDGRIVVESIWIRPHIECMHTGFRAKVNLTEIQNILGEEFTMEDAGGFKYFPSAEPAEPTTTEIPDLSFRAWKQGVLLADIYAGRVIDYLNQTNDPLWVNRNVNGSTQTLLNNLPAHFNLTGKFAVDPLLGIRPDGGDEATKVRRLFGDRCDGFQIRERFNSARRKPDTRCWFVFGSKEKAPELLGRNVEWRDMMSCAVRINISLERSTIDIANGSVSNVIPSRLPIPTWWAIENPTTAFPEEASLTMSVIAPYWRIGSCSSSNSADNTSAPLGCDSFLSSTVSWPAGEASYRPSYPSSIPRYAFENLVDYGLAQPDGFRNMLVGKFSQYVRDRWHGASQKILQGNVTGNATLQREGELEFTAYMRQWWTDGAVNTVGGWRPQFRTVEAMSRREAICHDPAYAFQLFLSLGLAILLLVVRSFMAKLWAGGVTALWKRQIRGAAQLDVGRAVVNTAAAIEWTQPTPQPEVTTVAGVESSKAWAKTDGSWKTTPLFRGEGEGVTEQNASEAQGVLAKLSLAFLAVVYFLKNRD
ncbi:hypothetical protein BJ742DRAFT_565207 [Cladochytrium replicatum]|nr:hypothetical protein BJ742DRAFT_565207 [Cladochytrium replicatum]